MSGTPGHHQGDQGNRWDAISRKECPPYLRLTDEEDYAHKGSWDSPASSLRYHRTLTLRGFFNRKGMMLPGLFARLRVR